MAEFKKIAKRRLPPPPPPEDASTTLQEPEVAPAAVTPARTVSEQRKIDARTLRKTGRTIQFATRVTEKFDRQFRAVAKRDNLMLATLLELALEAYENRLNKRSS